MRRAPRSGRGGWSGGGCSGSGTCTVTISAATTVTAPFDSSIFAPRDLDGDGRADLILRHTDGTVSAWFMNGLAVAGTTTFVGPGSGWTLVKTGDFNGDGKADLVWQHTDGTVQAWLMNGASVMQVATF